MISPEEYRKFRSIEDDMEECAGLLNCPLNKVVEKTRALIEQVEEKKLELLRLRELVELHTSNPCAKLESS